MNAYRLRFSTLAGSIMSLAMSEDKLETLVWALEQALPNKGPRRKHLKRTVAAILWRMRHGTPWRVIPGELGPWWQAKQSFARWAAYGVWRRVVALVRDIIGPDLEAAFLDGTVVRAHPKAAGAAGGAPAQALGRSRGGFGTKAMAVCDRRGRALAFTLLPGQASELRATTSLLAALPAGIGWIVGDRGFSSGAFRREIVRQGALPVVPAHPTHPAVGYDRCWYRRRHLIENLWARFKDWRCLATRYEKTTASFLASLELAAAIDWIN
jgi:transposase